MMSLMDIVNRVAENALQATNNNKMIENDNNKMLENDNNKMIENEKTKTIRKITVNDECLACGLCINECDWLVENEEGKAIAKDNIFLTSKDMDLFEKVKSICPVSAIGIKNCGRTTTEGEEGLKELLQIVKDLVENYEIKMPDSKEYYFDKEGYSVPKGYSSREYKYEYKSDSKAEYAGLKEFNRIMYSQRRALIQQILTQYKVNEVYKFFEDSDNEVNYFNKINIEFINLLHEIIYEAKVIEENLEFDEMLFEYIEPEFGRKGDKFDEEMYVYQIRHLEEIWLTDNIINELEDLNWFDVYVNTDYMENSRGKDIYCYKLAEVQEKFAQQILTETAYVLNSYDGVKKILEDNLVSVIKPMKEEMKKRFDTIISEIESFI